MNRSRRIALGLGVIAGACLGAVPFYRLKLPARAALVADREQASKLRDAVSLQMAVPLPARDLSLAPASEQLEIRFGEKPGSRLERVALPPALPGEFPDDPAAPNANSAARPAAAATAPTAEENRPTAPTVIRLHRIVDGDSLESLAERYLGSRERAEVIYDANRDVLSSPEKLPIGTRLKIESPK